MLPVRVLCCVWNGGVKWSIYEKNNSRPHQSKPEGIIGGISWGHVAPTPDGRDFVACGPSLPIENRDNDRSRCHRYILVCRTQHSNTALPA